MKLTITPEAEKQLNQLKNENDNYLLLWYDTEGCGCGVNGVPTIKFIQNKNNTYHEIETETNMLALIDGDQKVFFANDMKLDSKKGVFRLSSNEGILNAFIPLQSVCSTK